MKNNFKTKKSGYTHTPKFGVTPKGGGYTIIEMMIAISLFVVVIMIGMNSLLNANFVHQKSRDMRSVIDNLSFAMEDMSKFLRIGKEYYCIPKGGSIPSGDPGVSDCSDGGGISFKESISGQQWVYYFDSNNDGNISLFKSTDGGTTSVQLIPNNLEIDLTKSSFTVTGSSVGDADYEQPFVTIRLKGEIVYRGARSPFDIQTSVSQRLIDIGI